MQKKIAVLLAVLLMSFVFIGCGSKNPYVGYWAEDEGVWDFGAETTINEDGTFMRRLKDPTAGEDWGKWEETENGISLTYDKEYPTITSVVGHIDEELLQEQTLPHVSGNGR